MNLWNTISTGFKEIWAHKFRSLLTMLGIILGVSSLVSMSALVKGMEKGMKEALIAVGGLEKIRIEPQQELPIHQRHLTDQGRGVSMDDIYALRHNAPLVSELTPSIEIYRFGTPPVVGYRGKTMEPFLFAGTWPTFLGLNEHVVEHGRMFNEVDDENARSVCVIGTGIRDELFGDPEVTGNEVVPIGETITINQSPFTIVGMFQHYESEKERIERLQRKAAPVTSGTGPARSRGWGGRGGGSFIFRMKNGTILVPLTTMRLKARNVVESGPGSGRGGGGASTNSVVSNDQSEEFKLSTITMRIPKIELLEPALQQARNVLMMTHKGIEDFTFRTQEEWAENITLAIQNARMSGGIIAAISLLVGGIGIMNIMLASISERVREIGIRKAVGATTLDIFVQILIESVVISVLGGLAGLVAAFGLVNLIALMTPGDNAPIVTVAAMSVAFGFSVCVGVIAGLYPAVKASQFHPIQALRYD